MSGGNIFPNIAEEPCSKSEITAIPDRKLQVKLYCKTLNVCLVKKWPIRAIDYMIYNNNNNNKLSKNK